MKHVLLQKHLILVVLLALLGLASPLSLSASTNDLETLPIKEKEVVTSLPRVEVSQDGHFLVTETGEPFFWLGDTAWEMFARLTREEVEQYLENRRLKGFNVIQVVILTEHSMNIPNAYGDVAIANNNPLRPNKAYFEFVDWMITRAAEKGLYVGLLPTWGDKVNKLQGKGPVIFNLDNARRYGDYLGKRYRSATNVIWILGGDRNVQNKTQLAIWRAMAAGIEAGAGATALITYHPRGESSSAEWFNGDAAFDFNMLQSGHNTHDFPVWDLVTESYNLTPIKPVFDGEINYEDSPVDLDPKEGYFTDYDVRKQTYRSVFAGASGVTYGNHAIWQFYAPKRRGLASPLMYWYEALDRPGATQLHYVTNLMLSRPYLDRIPDQTVLLELSGQSTNATHIRATRARDGSYAFIYLPTNESISVDLSKIAGVVVRAWWYDPRTGDNLLIGEYAKSSQSSLTITPPASFEDSVLVLDDASREFTPPGGSDKVHRAINLNGPSMVIDGVKWEASTSATDLSLTNATPFCNQNVVLIPQTDSDTAKMLRCSVYGKQVELTLSNLQNGAYEVVLYTWEDNRAEIFNIDIEGQFAVVNHDSGEAGTWTRFEFPVITVSDNQLNIVTSGGHANLSGIEITHRKPEQP